MKQKFLYLMMMVCMCTMFAACGGGSQMAGSQENEEITDIANLNIVTEEYTVT